MDPKAPLPDQLLHPTSSRVSQRRKSRTPLPIASEAGTQTHTISRPCPPHISPRASSTRSEPPLQAPRPNHLPTSHHPLPRPTPLAPQSHHKLSDVPPRRSHSRASAASRSKSSASTLIRHVDSMESLGRDGMPIHIGAASEAEGGGSSASYVPYVAREGGELRRGLSPRGVRMLYNSSQAGTESLLAGTSVRTEDLEFERRSMSAREGRAEGSDAGSFRTAREGGAMPGGGEERKRRVQSERLERGRVGKGMGKGAVVVGRTRSLREGKGVLPGLFQRGKVVTWPVGVAPMVVYAAESREELEDGHGGGGLGPTLLCKMGVGYRGWDVVRGGEQVCVKIVGWHDGEGADGGRRVVYSVVNAKRAVVHDEVEGGAGVGYRYVSEGRGVAVRGSWDEGEGCLVRVGMMKGGEEGLRGEVKWRVGGVEARGGGGCVMRWGYYFFLKEACAVRLFVNTDTPEHVRLVVMRGGGGVDEEASRRLTYVVVRVGAD